MVLPFLYSSKEGLGEGMEQCSCRVCVPTGVDTMANYEEVLHLIRYRNWHTASLFDRKFKLLCSELNGRYVSNEFRVEVGELPMATRDSWSVIGSDFKLISGNGSIPGSVLYVNVILVLYFICL